MLHQLEQHAINRRRMNKRNQTTTSTNTRRLVNQPRTFAFQLGERSVNVGDFDCNVMHSLPALGEKLSHGGIRPQRLEQLDVSITHGEHAHFDTLFGDLFGGVNCQAQRIAPDSKTFFDAVGGYSDVINFQQPE